MIKITPTIYLAKEKNLDMILSGWEMIDCLFFVIYYKKL
jgi:hypothetical protein